jgi:hypothetical protein
MHRSPSSLTYADILGTCWPGNQWTFNGPDGDWDQFSWEPSNPDPQPMPQDIDAKRDLAAAIINERQRRQDALDNLRNIRPDIFIVMAISLADIIAQLRERVLTADQRAAVDWARFDDMATTLKAADSTGGFR